MSSICLDEPHKYNQSTWDGIQLLSVWHLIAQPFFIILPSSRYDLNNVERDVKYQIIITNHAQSTLSHATLVGWHGTVWTEHG